MTKQIIKNSRTFQIEATPIDRWNYEVSIFEIFADGSFTFAGKAISNNIDYAFNELIK